MVDTKDKAVTEESAEQTAEEGVRQPSEAEAPTAPEKPSKTETEPAEKPVKTPEEDEDEVPADVLEAMTEKQREAFQRQRQEIKALRQEAAKRKAGKSALDALSPKPFGQGMPNKPNAREYLNEDGTFDVVGYENAINQYQSQQNARLTAQTSNIRYETDRKLLSVRDQRFDPHSEGYDEALEKRVADRYGRLLMETLYQGKPEPSLLDVAAEVVRESGPTDKERQAISKETLERVSQKGQAASSAEAPNSSKRSQASLRDSEIETLSAQSKRGNLNALTELISAVEEKQSRG